MAAPGPARTTLRRHLRIAGLGAVAAVVLAGLGLAAPAYGATSVSAVSFTPGSTAAGASSSWTVSFTTSGNGQPLKGGGQILVGFPSGFSFSTTIGVQLSSSFSGCTATATASGTQVTVLLGGGNGCTLSKSSASLTLSTVNNPGAATYPSTGFVVSTTQDSQGQSASSAITIVQVPTKLAFTSSPANGQAGLLSPQPVVAVQDGTGTLVANATTAVTLAINGQGASLSCTPGSTTTVNAVNGVATFSGCSVTSTGTFTLTAKASGLTDGTSSSFTITAGPAARLGFGQQPSDPTFVGAGVSPAVTVQVQDTFGNAVASSGQTVTLRPSVGGTYTAVTNTAGLATFTAISFGNTALGVTLAASAPGVTGATSNGFNVTIAVNATANALSDTAVDSGSGTKTVSYYYCPGYSGTCTASSGTLIGSATTGTSYPVSWVSRPANGAYRVIAVATDKVGNVSSASGSTPVTVTG